MNTRTFIVRITRPLLGALREYFLSNTDNCERIGFAFGERVDTEQETYFLFAETPLLPADDCYSFRSSSRAELPKEIVDVVTLRFARSPHSVMLNMHSHPFSNGGTAFSGQDDDDDRRFAQYIHGPLRHMLKGRPDIGVDRPLSCLSWVFDHGGLAARVIEADGSFTAIEKIEVIGPHFEIIRPYNAPRPMERSRSRVHDRQRDFIPLSTQEELANLCVGVLGIGGVGRVIAEGFARMGVGEIVAVDHDRLEESNLNRWIGGARRDIGRNKAELLMESLETQVSTKVHAINTRLEDATEHLIRCQLIIACLDDDFPRIQVNRLAAQYLISWFDIGTIIRTGDEGLDFRHRILGVWPGSSACIECTQFEIIAADAYIRGVADKALRAGRKSAGYVVDQPEIDSPSVIGLNLTVAGELLSEFINYFVTSRPTPTQIYKRWRDDYHQRVDAEGFREIPAANCPACGMPLAAGNRIALPRDGSSDQTTWNELAEFRAQRTHKLAEGQ